MIQFIHIPKVGGTALAHATNGVIRHNGHTVTLSAIKPDDPAISIVRDPVARFLSAFAWVVERQLWPWATPDDMARHLDETDHVVFRPQTHWIDCDRPLLWVGRTETLDADFERLRAIVGGGLGRLPATGPERNESGHRLTLSGTAADIVREHYTDDYALIARLT